MGSRPSIPALIPSPSWPPVADLMSLPWRAVSVAAKRRVDGSSSEVDSRATTGDLLARRARAALCGGARRTGSGERRAGKRESREPRRTDNWRERGAGESWPLAEPRVGESRDLERAESCGTGEKREAGESRELERVESWDN